MENLKTNRKEANMVLCEFVNYNVRCIRLIYQIKLIIIGMAALDPGKTPEVTTSPMLLTQCGERE